MRALFWAALLPLVWLDCVTAWVAELTETVTICNKNWDPPCRDFPVTTMVRPTQATPEEKIAGTYSFRLNDLTPDELKKAFTLLGIDADKFDFGK